MPVHIWSKNASLLNAAPPKFRRVGYVRRRKSNASLVSDFIALRKTLFLCASCLGKMPWRWMRKYEYRTLPGMHGDASRCDGCQRIESGNLYLPEEGGYVQQYNHIERVHNNAAAQQVALREGRRIKGM